MITAVFRYAHLNREMDAGCHRHDIFPYASVHPLPVESSHFACEYSLVTQTNFEQAAANQSQQEVLQIPTR